MQENEFEKRIKDKMGELRIVPNDEMWARVLTDVQKENRKRRFLFFLLPLTILGLGLGVFLYHYNQKVIAVLSPINRTNSPKTTINKKAVNGNAKEFSNEGRSVTAIRKFIREKKAMTGDDISKIGGEKNNGAEAGRRFIPLIKIRNYVKSPIANLKQPGSNAVADTKKDKSLFNKNTKERGVASKTPVAQQQADTNVTVRKDTVTSIVKAIEKDSSKPTLAVVAETGKAKAEELKKWQLSFTILGGISNNHSGFGLFPYSSASYANSISPTTSVGNNAVDYNQSYRYSASYAFGVFATRQLKKKIALSVGINYRYSSAASEVGERASGSQTFYDLFSASLQTINQYYRPGQTIKYTNKYHFVELPVDLLFQLNKLQKKPILLTAGFSPCYLVSSKALYTNSSQNAYYPSAKQFKKWQLALQTGIQLNIVNTSVYEILVGPQLQYGLTNMAKSVTATDQHIITAAFKASFLLK